MSRRTNRPSSATRPQSKTDPATAPADGVEIRMKPQPVALAVLLLIFVAWLGLLLVIYFRTNAQPQPAAPALSSPTAYPVINNLS